MKTGTQNKDSSSVGQQQPSQLPSQPPPPPPPPPQSPPPMKGNVDDNDNNDDADLPTPAANRSSKRGKIGRRACDGCKVRKIRCSELPPCDRCVKVGIACTFNHVQAMRGPRSLREKTIRRIRTVQEAASYASHQQDPAAAAAAAAATAAATTSTTTMMMMTTSTTTPPATLGQLQSPPPPPPPLQSPPLQTPLSTLVYLLCTYRLRLFPVWPIVAVEEVMAALHRDGRDLSTYALANAVAAATAAQLKLDGSGGNTPSSASLEAEALRARRAVIDANLADDALMNLDYLRTTFFLHIYHENQQPGGARSLLYLREAIALAQMMRLHDAAACASSPAPAAEQMMGRRILWLLFVTERGVAMLHGLPVVLNPGPSARFPPLAGPVEQAGQSRAADDESNEAHVLPAFKKLVDLFCIFDRSGAFEMLRDSAGTASPAPSGAAATTTPVVGGRGTDIQESSSGTYTPPPEINSNRLQRCSALLRQQQIQDRQLAAASPESAGSGGSELGDVQKADVSVTQLWMQAVLWKLILRRRRLRRQHQHQQHPEVTLQTTRPLQIAVDLIGIVDSLPAAALESHGPTMELKIFDIASAVIDELSMSGKGGDNASADILSQLQRILVRCRGGNPKLLSLLQSKVEELQNGRSAPILDQAVNVHLGTADTSFPSRPAPAVPETARPFFGDAPYGNVLGYHQDTVPGRGGRLTVLGSPQPQPPPSLPSQHQHQHQHQQHYVVVGQGLHMAQVSAGDMLLGMSSDVEGLQVPIDGMADPGALFGDIVSAPGGFMWDSASLIDRGGAWHGGMTN